MSSQKSTAYQAVVVHSNEITRASYRLTAVESRIVLAAIAQIPHKGQISPDTAYWVSSNDLVSLGSDPKVVYTQIKKAASTLFERSITLREEDGIYRTLRWVYEVIYVDGEGRIGLKFAPSMLPYLSAVKKAFTQYSLSDIAGMQSEYAIRIYAMCMQFQSTGWLEISLDELRVALELKDRYKSNITMFKHKVLDVAANQINQAINAKITVRYELKKRGRRFEAVRFTFHRREENKASKILTLTEPQAMLFATKLVNEPDIWNRFYTQARQRGLNLYGLNTLQSISKTAEFLLEPGIAEEFKPWLQKVGYSEFAPRKRKKKTDSNR